MFKHLSLKYRAKSMGGGGKGTIPLINTKEGDVSHAEAWGGKGRGEAVFTYRLSGARRKRGAVFSRKEDPSRLPPGERGKVLRVIPSRTRMGEGLGKETEGPSILMHGKRLRGLLRRVRDKKGEKGGTFLSRRPGAEGKRTPPALHSPLPDGKGTGKVLSP